MASTGTEVDPGAGLLTSLLDVPINLAIYEYLSGVPSRITPVIDFVAATAEAATNVLTEYSDVVHKVVQNMVTTGLQIDGSLLAEQIRQILTGQVSPDLIFARMQQVLYLILLKKARVKLTNTSMTFGQMRNNQQLIRDLANDDYVKTAIRDMLATYYDLICGKSPMVHYDSNDIAEIGDDDASRLIASAAITLENEVWNAQQSDYKRLAEDEEFRVWFLNNILAQADERGVVDRDNVDHSFLSGVQLPGGLAELKQNATLAYKRNLNADIKRIVVKYNGYIQYAIPRSAKAGNFANIKADLGRLWKYIQDEQINTDVSPQINAMDEIMKACNGVSESINGGNLNLSINKLIATDDIDIVVRNGELIDVIVKERTAGRGGRRFGKSRRMKKKRQYGGRRPRYTMRRVKRRRTMRRRFRRRGSMRR